MLTSDDAILRVTDIARVRRRGDAWTENGTSGMNLFLDRFVDIVSGVFERVLGVLCAAGILKGLTAVTVVFGLDQKSGLYLILNAAGDGMFQYLPLFLAITAARHFKLDSFTGLALGCAMVYPTLATSIKSSTNFLGIPVMLSCRRILSDSRADYFGRMVCGNHPKANEKNHA